MAAPGWWIRFLAGPAAFVALYLINLSGLSQEGRVALATFVWAIVWWMLQPIPLGVTALLPLVVFPVLGTTSAGATASLYGQSIFFWILGTTMLGYAMQKHGLAKRFSLWFLGLPGVAGSTPRLVFVYMLTTALVSMFVSDTATVALMIPIGMSICAYVQDIQRGDGDVALSAREVHSRRLSPWGPCTPLRQEAWRLWWGSRITLWPHRSPSASPDKASVGSSGCWWDSRSPCCCW